MDCSLQGLVELHNTQMDYAFRSIVDAIVQNSKLNITLIRISNVTDDSLFVSIEARVLKTGPASATLSPMTISLCGPGGSFGQVTLPQIRTSSNGTFLEVSNQHVHITSVPALLDFIRPVISSSRATLSLREGHTTVRALGIGPREICYEKDVPLEGMCGPEVHVQSATFAAASSSSITLVLYVANTSPMEISFGTCGFDIQDRASGTVFAELKGRLDIRCNGFEATLQGTVVDKRAIVAAAEAFKEDRREGNAIRLVGKRCVGAAWCDETVKGIDVPIRNMEKVFNALGMGSEESEKPEVNQVEESERGNGEKAGGGGGWKSKLWKW
ncbi:hypothetical protein F5X99DRAFT_366246 [Biscogniauxia marginata]|nr:hypothetical protein F5X99DRAFT_366246 [Biscogniauxia marginata]